MFDTVRKTTSQIGMTHRLEQHFGTTKWLSVKKPHIPFDAVFHALSEYGLKTKEKDVLHGQNREILPINTENLYFSLIFRWFCYNSSAFNWNKYYIWNQHQKLNRSMYISKNSENFRFSRKNLPRVPLRDQSKNEFNKTMTFIVQSMFSWLFPGF